MPTYTLHSPARGAIFRALAEASEPLDRTQLAALTGISRKYVYDVLVRPVRMGWVTITTVPNANANAHGIKYLYEITDTGRVQLARYIKPANKEG